MNREIGIPPEVGVPQDVDIDSEMVRWENTHDSCQRVCPIHLVLPCQSGRLTDNHPEAKPALCCCTPSAQEEQRRQNERLAFCPLYHGEPSTCCSWIT